LSLRSYRGRDFALVLSSARRLAIGRTQQNAVISERDLELVLGLEPKLAANAGGQLHPTVIVHLHVSHFELVPDALGMRADALTLC
jgi:hypothetical protein